MKRLLAGSTMFLATHAFAGDIDASEMAIGHVASGATESTVLRQLGAPNGRVDTGEGVRLTYSGLVVSLGYTEEKVSGSERRVFAIFGTGPTACTPKGLCPGMPASAVAVLYGPIQPTVRETGTFYEYQPAGSNCWLQVSAPADVVETLGVVCQP